MTAATATAAVRMVVPVSAATATAAVRMFVRMSAASRAGRADFLARQQRGDRSVGVARDSGVKLDSGGV